MFRACQAWLQHSPRRKEQEQAGQGQGQDQRRLRQEYIFFY